MGMFRNTVLETDCTGLYRYKQRTLPDRFETVVVHPFYDNAPQEYCDAIQEILSSKEPILILEPKRSVHSTAKKIYKEELNLNHWFARTNPHGVRLWDMSWDTLCDLINRQRPSNVNIAGMYLWGHKGFWSGCVGAAIREMQTRSIEALPIPGGTHNNILKRPSETTEYEFEDAGRIPYS